MWWFLAILVVSCGGTGAAPTATIAPSPTATPVVRIKMEHFSDDGYGGAVTLDVAAGEKQKVVLSVLPPSQVQKTTTYAEIKNVVAIAVFVTNVGSKDTSVGTILVRWSDGSETERVSTVVSSKDANPQSSTLTAGGKTDYLRFYDPPKGTTLVWARYSIAPSTPSGTCSFDV